MQRHLIAETDARLLQYARRLRQLQSQNHRVQTAIHVWLIRPSQQALVFAGLFFLTAIVAATRPKLLYDVETTVLVDGNDSFPFLHYRVLILFLFALVQVVVGEPLMQEEELPFGIPVLDFILSQILFIVGIFIYLLYSSISTWIGSRVGNAPLSLNQSLKVTAYGIVAALTIVLVLPVMALPIVFPSVLMLIAGEPEPDLAVVIAIVMIIPILFIMLYCLVHLTFIAPVSTLYPCSSKGRLWFGWFVGVSLPILIILAVVALAFSVLLIFGLVDPA